MAAKKILFQDPFRPAYEAIASGVWFVTGLLAYYLAHHTILPTPPFMGLMAVCLVMAVIRLIPAVRLWAVRYRVREGFPLAFIAPKTLLRQMRTDQFWLGTGFEWTAAQTVFANEILRRDARALGLTESATPGAGWIHSIGPPEQPIYIPATMFHGQTLVVGTTGAGKTRLMETLIVQCVAKGHAVIIIDPKSDLDLRQSAQRACHLVGQPERFVFFNPAFPEHSARLDPLRNWNRSTELANRIASLIPSQSASDPWKAFSQRVLDTVVSGLVASRELPNLLKIRAAIEGGIEPLLEKTLTAHFRDLLGDGWEADIRELSTTVLRPTPRKPRDLDGMIRYYKEKVRDDHPSTAIEGLLSMHQHDHAHFSKMIASLLPVLNMLTSGHLAALLSPNRTDDQDPRPVWDVASIINQQKVLYLGLDSLSDAMVGSAIGSIFLADLTAACGDRYNYGIQDQQEIFVFVDEAAEVATDTLIQLLNKSRGSGTRITLATQTFADFAARLGSESKARQVLANCNNVIALRVLDGETQEYLADGLIKTKVPVIRESEGESAHSNNPVLYSASYGTSLSEEEADLFPAPLLGQLPNLHYIAKLTGGRLIKGRLPILQSTLRVAADEQIRRHQER